MRKLLNATAATALIALIGGCGGVEIGEDDDLQPAGAVVVRSTTVVDEQYSGIGEQRRQVIRSEAQWRDFWNRLHRARTPRPSRPRIDFDRDVVIVAAMGERPTGGYTVEIENVYRTPSGLSAVVVETRPGEGCAVTQAATAPVSAVRVRLPGQPVSFVERQRVRRC